MAAALPDEEATQERPKDDCILDVITFLLFLLCAEITDIMQTLSGVSFLVIFMGEVTICSDHESNNSAIVHLYSIILKLYGRI